MSKLTVGQLQAESDEPVEGELIIERIEKDVVRKP
jgi:hypothetical protein